MKHQPFTLLLHIALVIILAGAIVTHFWGIQGTLTLQTGAPAVTHFSKESGPGNGELPFEVSLEKVEVIYYPATTTPMDFRSEINVGGRRISVAMNRVGEYEGWRFYQSGIGGDSSILSISHDPWGIGITYSGYALLFLGLFGFFFQKRTSWRALLRKYRQAVALVILLFAVTPAVASAGTSADLTRLKVMQKPLAANLGKVLVYWNDRVAPMQTMAYDVTSSLYGSDSYKGYTPEQVLSGWLFYYDQWARDYFNNFPEVKTAPSEPSTRKEKKLAEKLALVQWIGTGEIFKIYPYLAVDGHIEWLSLTGRRPSGMSLDQWTFMQTSMPAIKELLMTGKNIEANVLLNELKAGQKKYAIGTELPSDGKIKAEILYNRTMRPAIAGIVAILIGLTILMLPLFRSCGKWLESTGLIVSLLLFIYSGLMLGMLWWIGGHVPVSNGPETMMFMAFVSLLGAVVSRNSTLRGGLLIVAAISLFVAAMGGRTPRIGAMMPVLSSPLLSVHVMVVMIAYSLFLLIAILSTVALLSHSKERMNKLSILNRLLLTPAVALLGAGIFIGAIWANQTWGRYWGWDPKETCALIMWIVYAFPVHWSNRYLSFFRNDRVLHVYLLAAILTVAFTYFGANYLLGGLHSYA